MDSPNLLSAGEVRDGAGNAKDAMEAARREAHRRCGIGEKLAPGLVRGGNPVEKFAVSLGVRAWAMAVVAIGLKLPGSSDTARDFRASFSGWRKSEVCGGNARHLDMQVHAVQQRT